MTNPASLSYSENQVIIIGAGPAGLSAAVQLRRYGLQPVVFEGARVGGLLWNANLVENYPGFPKGISGPVLVGLFQQQAQLLGVEITHELVNRVAWEDELFLVTTSDKLYTSRYLVLAMGTRPLQFSGLHIPPALQERVLYEVQPILHLSGKTIVIVGAGDAAFDYALNLGTGNQVHIVNRGQQRKCLQLLADRVALLPNIRYHENTSLIGVEDALMDRIKLSFSSITGNFMMSVDYLVGALGREARLDCLPEAIRQQSDLLVQRNRLFFIGDIKNGMFRQTAIAVGDGLMAAMHIFQHISN